MPRKAKLDSEMIKEIAGYAIDHYRELEATAVKARHEKKKEIVKLLLENYRGLLANDESAIYKVTQAIGADVCFILNQIEAILGIYKSYCDRSTKKEDERRYRSVFWRYIATEAKTVAEIAEGEFVDHGTIYRDIIDAVDYLTVLFFGIDGLAWR